MAKTNGTGSDKTNASKDDVTMPDPAEFSKNMVKVAMQSQRLIADFVNRQVQTGVAAPGDPFNVMGAFGEVLSRMASHPEQLLQSQIDLWQAHFNLWTTTARRMMGHDVDPVVSPARGDKRFRHDDWQENEVFDFIKQSYLLTANWLTDTVGNVEGVERDTKAKINFFTKQFADALAPSNFLLTNPEVLRETLRTNGDNLVRGLNNLLEDIERGDGQVMIRQTDEAAFEVGRNIAVTPGKVVYRNELAELLQYEPTTDEVFKRPLLIIPPWINKFYILDLKPENSFIKWATERGYTVFVVSWVNPDARLALKGFADYMHHGILDMLDAIEKATGEQDVSAIGYCIGGTLLSSTLAYMAEKGDDRIKAATFFAAQVDFSEAGELQVFIDEAQIKQLAERMDKSGGVLEGKDMATTFNMLRANDLIWSYVVNNYLMGREPVPFDLLYWNGDTTRMPKAMHLYYLNHCYRKNMLAKGEMVLDDVKLDLSKIKIPIYLQSSREDHIAPYRSIYKATQLYSGPVRFMVAGSGHIAGVINPPVAKKYQHWLNPDLPATVDEWFQGAQEHPGSWWNDWHGWLSKKSGKKVPARKPGDGALKAIEDAPGSYVKMKAH